MLFHFFRCVVLIILASQLWGCKDPFNDAQGTSSNRSQQDPLADVKIMFDWNEAPDDAICTGLEANNRLLSLGAAFSVGNTGSNRQAVDALEDVITTEFAEAARVVSRENRLAILTIELFDCSVLADIRALPQVKFVEPKYLAPISEEDIFNRLTQTDMQSLYPRRREVKDPSINPGFYEPGNETLSYPDYVRQVNGNIADIMQRHGVARIYEEFGYFGRPNLGVAVIDNGIFPDWEDYMSQGDGSFETRGYYRPYGSSLTPDGSQPQSYDIYGILQNIDSIYEHGTRQTERVYSMAPDINLISTRASPFVFWFLPTQFQGVTDTILALAEDPSVRIISSSMGTVIHVHEIERAIDYFNGFDKLFISAAGTSMPFVKDFVKIVFPATLPSTISTTGIMDTQITGSNFELGKNSHGGVENDFVVDHADSSSESVSASAGMIGLIWSANPDISRNQLLEILKRNSSNYRSNRRKDPVFGWGKIDMYQAFLDVRAATPDP